MRNMTESDNQTAKRDLPCLRKKKMAADWSTEKKQRNVIVILWVYLFVCCGLGFFCLFCFILSFNLARLCADEWILREYRLQVENLPYKSERNYPDTIYLQ